MMATKTGAWRWVLVAAMLAMALATAEAQQQPVTALPNTIYVTGAGKFDAQPDTALVQFNIAAQEKTTQAAYERASRAAQQVRELLRSNGVDPKSAEVGYFSISPVVDYTQPKQKIVGYRASSSVTVKLKDLSKVSGVVEQLGNLDVTNSNSVSYTLDDMDAAKTKALENAFQRARGEAQTVARAGGRILGEMTYAAVDVSDAVSVPRPMMKAMRMDAAGAPAPTEEFSPRSITVTARVSVVFALK